MLITMTLHAMHAIYLTDEDINHIVGEIREQLFVMRDAGCKSPANVYSEYRWTPSKEIVERTKNYNKIIKGEA